MIVIASLALGVVTGALLAKRGGGSTTDMAHYAAVYGIAFTLAGLFGTLFLGRVLL
ncbi:hypothetical protein [Neogemmobacter tilapiae]|uniref:Apolipoprotein acyltransferase n=1 Tax=Neogemmobacter tilapiae TaxID=875041 RepID=A0A918TEH6_9RHOB|nr:hypothetical protein [Gemmobacter tilapiae]GHC44586.1 hypothetical protein GCM10007315_02260 [Gemmobacter tilapiae]